MMSVDTLDDDRPDSRLTFSPDELHFYKCVCHTAVPAFKESMVTEDFTLAVDAALQLLRHTLLQHG